MCASHAPAVARHPAMSSYVTRGPAGSNTSGGLVFCDNWVKVTSDPHDANEAFANGTSGIDLLCYKSAVFLFRMSDGLNSSSGKNGNGGGDEAADDYEADGYDDDDVDGNEDSPILVADFTAAANARRAARATARQRRQQQQITGGTPSSLYPKTSESRDAFLRRRYATIMTACGGNQGGGGSGGTAPLSTRLFFMIVYCDEPLPDTAFMTWLNTTALDSGAKLLLVWTPQEAATIMECLMSEAFNNEGHLHASLLTAGKPFAASFTAPPLRGSGNGGGASANGGAAAGGTSSSGGSGSGGGGSLSSLELQRRQQQQRLAAAKFREKSTAEHLQNAFSVIPTLQKTDTSRLLNEAGTVAALLLSDPKVFVERIPLFTKKKADRLFDVLNAEFPTTATRLSEMQKQLVAEEGGGGGGESVGGFADGVVGSGSGIADVLSAFVASGGATTLTSAAAAAAPENGTSNANTVSSSGFCNTSGLATTGAVGGVQGVPVEGQPLRRRHGEGNFGVVVNLVDADTFVGGAAVAAAAASEGATARTDAYVTNIVSSAAEPQPPQQQLPPAAVASFSQSMREAMLRQAFAVGGADSDEDDNAVGLQL